jgi:hypothetical protein
MQGNDRGAAPEARPPRGSRRRRRIEVLVVVILLVAGGVVVKVVLTPEPERPEVITPESTIVPPGLVPDERVMNARAAACLGATRRRAGRIARVAGAVRTYRLNAVPNSKTYDLRDARIVGYPNANKYPLALGKRDPGTSTCVVGGTVVGSQSRSLTWQVMKGSLDGDGLNLRSHGGVVDGIRIDNVEDGIGTIGGDPQGVMIRNAHMTYIRDDCLENDAVVGLIVKDSLLDGCFFGLSERPGRGGTPRPALATEQTLLDGVLMRLEPMPYERSEARCAADGLGTGGFFKWSAYANKLVVRNSVLFAERLAARCGGAMHFPSNAIFENVTLVWLGPGDYPGNLPTSGVTVTRDRDVWDRAKAAWLLRHGESSQP